ncbi:hypothetical protein GCM10022295_38120 [Streptomyces osmaniensis]|uniref:Uncharacterized protein n=1 Tax=Streptomyces osmaniensis TaxID=593134 RepID=A0ABP6WM60_9ACTN
MAQLRSRNFRFAAITGLATAALVGGLTALPAQAAPAEGKVLAAGSPTAVKDSYIVTLKRSAASRRPPVPARAWSRSTAARWTRRSAPR